MTSPRTTKMTDQRQKISFRTAGRAPTKEEISRENKVIKENKKDIKEIIKKNKNSVEEMTKMTTESSARMEGQIEKLGQEMKISNTNLQKTLTNLAQTLTQLLTPKNQASRTSGLADVQEQSQKQPETS